MLDLAANKIQSIHSNAFRSLNRVYELHLSQNFMKEMPQNLFTEMSRLKKLMLFRYGFGAFEISSFVIAAQINLFINFPLFASNEFSFLHSQSFVGLR